jgi:hypothetical protein
VKSSNFGELNHESCREAKLSSLRLPLLPLSKNHHSAAALIRLANSWAHKLFWKKNLLISTAAPLTAVLGQAVVADFLHAGLELSCESSGGLNL